MRPERTLWSVLSKTTPEQRSEAFSWLLFNVAGATLPIWLGGYLLLPVFGKHFSWLEYSQHGELALYSAALLAPTLRVIAKDVGESEFVRRQYFLFLGWICFTGSVALYSGVIAVAGMPPAQATLNGVLLFKFSLSLLILTVLISFVVRLVDFQRIQPKEILDLQEASKERLESDFDKTAPQSNEAPGAEISEAVTQQSSVGADATIPTAAPGPNEKLDRDFDADRGADDGRRKKD
jgi:hypothetical protein